MIPRLNVCALAFPLISSIAACRSSDRASAEQETRVATESNSASEEKPAWRFGEETVRTDALPAALDTMVAWGEYPSGTRPVAYGIDLNRDGNTEWFVRGDRTLCGRAGCPTALMTRAESGSFVDLLGGLIREVNVTNHRTHGWPVLWVLVGGRDGGLFRMEFTNGTYGLSRQLGRTKDAEEWTAADDSLTALLSGTPSR